MNENQTPQAQTQEVSAETLAGATKRAVVTLPQTAFKKRLERAAERGTRETLTQLPQVLKAQYGLDLEEIKALVAENKAAQAQQRAPTTQEVRQENPREPGETKPDYEARVKELLEAQRAEFKKELEAQRAEHDKTLKELSEWRAQKEAAEKEALDQAETEQAWEEWRGLMTEKGVNPKRLRFVESYAHRFLEDLYGQNPEHAIFKDDATDAQRAEAWQKDFLEPLQKDMPELFGEPAQPGSPARPPGQGPGGTRPAVNAMQMKPEELAAYKAKMGWS